MFAGRRERYLHVRRLWSRSSHRLFGVWGLDPAGNVLCRWRFNRPASAGGWVALEDSSPLPLPYPMHWRADIERKRLLQELQARQEAGVEAQFENLQKSMAPSGDLTSASAATTPLPEDGTTPSSTAAGNNGSSVTSKTTSTMAKAAGFFSAMADEKRWCATHVPLYDQRLRLSKVKTAMYKSLFYSMYIAAGTLFFSTYLVFRSWVDAPARRNLARLERAFSAFFHAVKDSIRSYVPALGPALDILEAVLRLCASFVQAAATPLGYRADADEVDRREVETIVKKEKLEQRKHNHAATKWARIGVFFIAFALLFFIIF